MAAHTTTEIDYALFEDGRGLTPWLHAPQRRALGGLIAAALSERPYNRAEPERSKSAVWEAVRERVIDGAGRTVEAALGQHPRGGPGACFEIASVLLAAAGRRDELRCQLAALDTLPEITYINERAPARAYGVNPHQPFAGGDA
jgi:hypothetical protein